jgi:hypothetical protein
MHTRSLPLVIRSTDGKPWNIPEQLIHKKYQLFEWT